MKNILLCLLLCFALAPLTKAQGVLNKPSLTQLPEVLPINDIPGTSIGILSLLKTKLALSDSQSPKVTTLLTDFLKSKSSILGLAKTKPADYTSKFSGISSKLFTGLKSLLTAAQYSKLLALKPKASDASNLLSHLFF